MPIPYELLEQIRNGSLAITDLLDSTRDSSREDQIEILSLDLKSHWDKPSQRTVEDYLKLIPDLASAPELLVPLIVAEYSARIDSGELPTQSEYLLRFPSLQTELKNALDPNALHPTTTISTMFSSKDSPKILANRYKLIERVGAGSFGEVFMALDMKLERPVAIKAPKKIESGSSPSNEYLSEARTLAKFEHPNIVSIYDIGTTPEGETYFVTQYVKGGTLKDNASKFQGNFDKIATAFSQLADALNFAHQRRIIHRDIKPANILIDAKTEKPLVADFGLAILQEDLSQSHRTGGSLAYMSPEQIRGENHRLDGRSDIFSLGVVLYELLTGQLPFLGSQGEIVTAILHSDPAPPCSIDPSIPSELERICLKALSKSPGDRYSHASLMAEDLRTWNTATPAKTVSDDKVEIIPKGLRSFDEKDAGFFLSLLPGQRNREGLPESIAFWKEKIQQRDPDKTFSVGLIYGPSGCGKSSLVKAGLLPNLSKDILAIYVEATPEETETRILNGLKKAIPKLGTAEGKPLDLAEVLKALRKATGSRRQKVVLVLDQFEQWLHGHDDYATATLTDALRQCDGANVQAIILVREDFWVSISRFQIGRAHV